MYRLTVKLIEKSASLIAVEAEIIKYTQNNYPLGQLLYMMYNQKNHNKPIVICFPNYRVSVQPTSKLYKRDLASLMKDVFTKYPSITKIEAEQII